MQRTPLYDRHVSLGGRMVEFAGWEMPVQYAGLRQEHLAVRGGVGVFDVSHMGEVLVRGPKALAALQALVSNDVAKAGVGTAQYAMLCNETGGVVDDLYVYRLGDEEYLVVINASNRHKDVAWIREHDRTGADIADVSDDTGLLAVQGPEAVSTVQRLSPTPLASLPPKGVRRAEVAGVECLVARTGYTGEDGVEVFVPPDRVGHLWDAILEAGASLGIQPCGLGARDTLRLEVKNALYGHELNDDTSPFQAGLGWVVALDKPGGFVGADALRARRGTEPERLVGLVGQEKRIARDGMTVLHEGQPAGRVTSGTLSPSLDVPIAMAYVRRDLTTPGTRLVVDVRGKEATFEVVKGPFYKRTGDA